MKDRIAIVVYANPDYLPPVINTIFILSKEFDVVVISRNQDKVRNSYPGNVRFYRFGRLKTAREKETQGFFAKVLEYGIFSIGAFFYARFYRCKIVYCYDMHGFVVGFISSRIGRRLSLIYHHLDFEKADDLGNMSSSIKYLELRWAKHADKIVFPDLNRARFFKAQAKLTELPAVVMNTPLCINELPKNKLRDILKAKGFSLNTEVVLYQGVICDTHCVLEIIKSMVLWPKDVILVLLGYVWRDFLKHIYRTAMSFELDERIIYLPEVPYFDIFSYTRGAYLGLALYKPIGINQRFNAGAANKIFEYLSLGIPVVTNDSPYFREVIDSSVAYFAKPDSPEDIAQAVNSALLDEGEYHRKSQSARQAHLARLHYEEQFKTVIECIRGLLKRNI